VGGGGALGQGLGGKTSFQEKTEKKRASKGTGSCGKCGGTAQEGGVTKNVPKDSGVTRAKREPAGKEKVKKKIDGLVGFEW